MWEKLLSTEAVEIYTIFASRFINCALYLPQVVAQFHKLCMIMNRTLMYVSLGVLEFVAGW